MREGKRERREGRRGRDDMSYTVHVIYSEHIHCILNMVTQSYTSHETRWCYSLQPLPPPLAMNIRMTNTFAKVCSDLTCIICWMVMDRHDLN